MRSFLIPIGVIFTAALSPGQAPFNSGSTGADGPLTYAPGLGNVNFPPTGLGIRPNNIYNFTTITIGAGTIVRLSGWTFNSPVYWLAQGDVTINGGLDLNGKNGQAATGPSDRAPSEPGAGGYAGGVGTGLTTGQNATVGFGAGGGRAAGYNPTLPIDGGPATFAGSSYLQPLTGGSGGGGGGPTFSGAWGSSGGAGGGAILIASSTQITINQTGYINASGGTIVSGTGGGASGGAIRLVSNTVTDNLPNVGNSYGPNIYVCGLDGRSGFASGGVARIEAFSIIGQNISFGGGIPVTQWQGCGLATPGSMIASQPYKLAPPTGPSAVSVTSVNGTPINANPFTFPDVTINTSGPVPVVISGTNVPPGTKGTLYIFSENQPDQAVSFTLNGTFASTTATVNITYPPGGSRGLAKATW